MHMEAYRAYQALVKESKAQGLPKAFAADLTTHDHEALSRMGEGNRPIRFVWILRECGTEFVSWHHAQALVEYYQRPATEQVLFYIYDDGGLMDATADQALQFARESLPRYPERR